MTPASLSGTLSPGGNPVTITTEPTTDQRQAWKSPLVREGQRTGDGRLVRQGATVWGKDGTSDTGPDVRELPLPFFFQRETPAGGLGGNPHAGAVPVGAMTHVWRDPADPSLVMAAGWYDDSDDAREAARMADNGMVSGVSADLDDCDGEPGDDGGPEWTHARLMGACYDDATEVLTEERGWQKFGALTFLDRVATRDPKTGAFEWQDPFYFHHDKWSGPMYRFTGGTTHRTLDLLVTPNHRMLVESTCTGKPSFMSAEELATKGKRSYRIPLTSTWDVPDVRTFRIPGPEPQPEHLCACGCGEETPPRPKRTAGGPAGSYPVTLQGHGYGYSTDDLVLDGDVFAAFMGAWLSEGSVSPKRAVVQVYQRPTSKGYALFSALWYRMFGHGTNGHGAFVGHSRRLADYLVQFGHAPEKFVPDELKDFSARQLRIFWDHYMAGDGDAEGRRAYTSSPRLAGDLQEIAQKLGMWAVVNERGYHESMIDGRLVKPTCPGYVVAIRNRPQSRPANAVWDWTAERIDHWEGDVRCCSVPNEALYVRRGGIPVWCGNTQVPFPALPGSKVSVISPEEFAELANTVEALATQSDSPPPASGGEQDEPDADDVHTFTDSNGNGDCDVCGMNEDGHDAAQTLIKNKPQAVTPEAVSVRHVTALEALTAAGTPQPWGNETWFQDPDLQGPTPLTVTDEVDQYGSRRVFGHAFCWGTPHTALGGTVTPPKSRSGYAYFMLHSRRTACDCPDQGGQVEIPVGYLTFGTTHYRNLRGNIQAALDHYDHTGYRAAAVAFGEDDHGGWFAGATDPALDDTRMNDLFGATLSGDWRWAAGSRELVALLGVNVPGFPVPRGPAFHVERGRATALVAAGILVPDSVAASGLEEVIDALSARVSGLENENRTLARLASVVEPMARDQLLARLQIALPDLDAYEREMSLAVRLAKDPKAPYGDVDYADVGAQADGKKRYPIDSEAHVRAAWSYINQKSNQSPYTAGQVKVIKGRIKAAGRKYGISFSDDA